MLNFELIAKFNIMLYLRLNFMLINYLLLPESKLAWNIVKHIDLMKLPRYTFFSWDNVWVISMSQSRGDIVIFKRRYCPNVMVI